MRPSLRWWLLNRLIPSSDKAVDAGQWTISTSGGTRALWARGGKELFYLDGSGAMTRVPIQTAPTFSAGTPTTLFAMRHNAGPAGRSYDVSPDGQRAGLDHGRRVELAGRAEGQATGEVSGGR